GEGAEAWQYFARIEQILKAAESSVILLPWHDIIRAHNACALLWVKAGRNERAAERVEYALSLDPENAYTRRAYAKVLGALGKVEEAQKQCAEARALGMPVSLVEG